jgi:hypothetical protein
MGWSQLKLPIPSHTNYRAGLSFSGTGFIVQRQLVGMKQIHLVSKSEEQKPAAGVRLMQRCENFSLWCPVI